MSCAGFVCADEGPAPADETHAWAVHDPTRPLPPKVDPGPASGAPAPIPADAVVLFDGTDPDADLSAWHAAGNPWTVRDGYFEVPEGGKWLGSIEKFGDAQVHVEWMVPESEADDGGQGRGNSGVFLMGRYEVQILESRDGTPYADGMAGAVYGQNPPLVNPGRGVGEWQTYDIVFRAPRFTSDGGLQEPATVTVHHNGVLVQDHWVLEGRTRHKVRASYEAHEPEAPLALQDHGDPIRFRSVWVRPLPPRPTPSAEPSSNPSPPSSPNDR